MVLGMLCLDGEIILAKVARGCERTRRASWWVSFLLVRFLWTCKENEHSHLMLFYLVT